MPKLSLACLSLGWVILISYLARFRNTKLSKLFKVAGIRGKADVGIVRTPGHTCSDWLRSTCRAPTQRMTKQRGSYFTSTTTYIASWSHHRRRHRWRSSPRPTSSHWTWWPNQKCWCSTFLIFLRVRRPDRRFKTNFSTLWCHRLRRRSPHPPRGPLRRPSKN